MKIDDNLINVLNDDGIKDIDWKMVKMFENKTSVNLKEVRREFGMSSWAVRLAYNDRFGGVLIQQQAGEGNRKHYHPDADENWVILDGIWEWWIDGVGIEKVSKNDIITVPKLVLHQIKCIKGPGVRYAITKPDVGHVYEE